MVALDCAAKSELGIEGIVGMVKARSRAETVLALARKDGDQRPPQELTFHVHMMRAGKVEQSEVSVQSLFDQAKPLDAHRAGCLTCPANRDSTTGYGCYDSIAYPIEAETENWLLACLPESLESPAGFMFKSALHDFAWDGTQAADMRRQGDTFFRLRTAPSRSWPGGVTISGDQVFHMIFHVGNIGASHALMLGLFFGFVSIGELAPQPAPIPDIGNAHQMARFLSTLGRAASQKLDVLIDG